jgi:hypothetical protein
MTRTLTIVQQGLVSFSVCKRCNGRFESKLLNLFKVKKDLLEKYALHKCREVQASITVHEQTESPATHVE